MSKGQGNIASAVREIVSATVDSMGFDIWDITYEKEGGEMCLSVVIDSRSEKTIDVNDVEAVHRAISPLLDESDPIGEAYVLEVSSPGVERNIRTAEHWSKCIGCDVELKLYSALAFDGKGGRKNYVGRLVSSDNDNVVVDCDGCEVVVPHKLISAANTYYDFDSDDNNADCGNESEADGE